MSTLASMPPGSCPVHGLNECLAVSDHDRRAERTRPAGEFRECFRRNMREFNSRQRQDIPAAAQFFAGMSHTGNGKIEVRGVGMVRDGDHLIALHDCAPHQFRRDQHPVAEQRMGMKIDHNDSFY
jgi:hypothetical protein